MRYLYKMLLLKYEKFDKNAIKYFEKFDKMNTFAIINQTIIRNDI